MNNEHVNQYAERDAMQLDKDGGYYSRHIQAMTREGLHSKGDIAAELAWRDQQIDQLKADLEERRSKYRDLSQPVDPQISEYEKIMLQAGNSPAVRFDNRYITTRLEVFEDTYEIIAWLERMANECCDPDDKYGLKEAATSLRGMYADLKEFGGALMQIQGKSGPEAEK
ncbi:hypothetical protein R537_23775 [Salmonella enterica subsp. enterica serovar Rough O:d:1,7]|uniref:Uncharacterized protein n=1 Tax=Salmonella enterica subsp. enterica serovar Rough O:d:1,7 TaxID=1974323 RepID=A0A974KDN7_SALET|nr:hypothetical protein [Salmonella enterica]ASD87241.1 hypothetical protein LFZ16_13955 [Salmonella enterica subsp. enterica serovar India str. SA20085604]OSD64211.1 hypothetical protein R537_23775 [Salmonella enterica subsp. enterica serovar Rough O:d:1,7]